MISLLVLACMTYASGYFVIIYHGDGVLPRLIVVLPSLTIFGIAMVLWGLLSFSSLFHYAFGYGLIY